MKCIVTIGGKLSAFIFLSLFFAHTNTQGQAAVAISPRTTQEARIERLIQAVDEVAAQIQTSQRELDGLRQQLAQLRGDMAEASPAPTSRPDLDNAEQLSLEESQIATLDQAKVESDSKFPLRVTGTILLNGFTNSGHVDQASAPTSVLLNNAGTTGLAIRQTVLGIDAVGPHLLGAVSRADLRVDFFGTSGTQSYVNAGGVLRLRTAHAGLDWRKTHVFFSLDRPLLNPNAPESLVAVAQPELAWSGNLWSWNPQVGGSHTLGTHTRLRIEAAVIDPGDPTVAQTTTSSAPANNFSEASERPGVEARLAVMGSDDTHSAQFGVGGYFATHLIATASPSQGNHFDAWAGTIDYHLPLPHGLMLSGSAYRGQSLGGLGGGVYKDYVARSIGGTLQFRALDDVGGWSQLHQTVNLRVQWNVGFGIDNGFAKEIRAYPGGSSSNLYQAIARNRTSFANVIYSPRSSLLFSLEYRNLYTAPIAGIGWTSNTTGLGAAYRF